LRGYEAEVTMRRSTKVLLIAALCAATAVGGCNRTAGSPTAGPNPGASTASSAPSDWPKLPEGVACTEDLERFQTILKSDVEKGYINRPVYEQVVPELRTAAEACAAGRDAEARKLVQASKKRYGYRS
jgi:hypothetical protein